MLSDSEHHGPVGGQFGQKSGGYFLSILLKSLRFALIRVG
jgi:hypothetical protein